MRAHAFIVEDKVVKIDKISKEDYYKEINKYTAIWDIEDEIIKPQVGWVVSGNKLVPFDSSISLEEKERFKMEYRLKEGNKIADEITIKLSVRNRLLNKSSQEVLGLISALMPAEAALRKCALPTALHIVRTIKSSYSEYEDIFNEVEEQILNALSYESKC